MSTRREAKDTQYRLRKAIARAETLQHRCLLQLCDADLTEADRKQAETSLGRAKGVIDDLSPSLDQLERWLADDLAAKRL